MKYPTITAALILSISSTMAIAQDATPAEAVPATPVEVAPMAATPTVTIAPQMGNTVRAGTEVVLKTKEELTTKGKKLKVGHRVMMEVAEPITYNVMAILLFRSGRVQLAKSPKSATKGCGANPATSRCG